MTGVTDATDAAGAEEAVRRLVEELHTPDVEVVACDPTLADTAAFCAAYGYAPEDSANTIVVVGRSDPPTHVMCVVLATTRLDVNGAVRTRLRATNPGVRKASFAAGDVTAELTGMAIGGVTPFGRPAAFAAVDRRRGDGTRADRGRRWQPSVQGGRAASDAARAARRRGGRRTGSMIVAPASARRLGAIALISLLGA